MANVIGTVTTSVSTSLTLDLDALTTRTAILLRRNDLNTEIQQWLNFSVRELTDRVNFPELREEAFTTLVDGQYQYTVPSDFAREDKIFYKNDLASPTWGRTLTVMPRKMYEDLDFERLVEVSSPVKGDPRNYFIDGTDIYLYPVPNAATRIELSYYTLPLDMTLGTHEPVINTRWRHYLIYLAYYWGMIFLEKEDMNKVAYWERKKDRVIKRVRQLVHRTENRNLRIITPPTGTERADRIY